eukprot:SAG31_NODE_14756_length_789_cov_0.950725_2_plen_52_part_00
MMWKTANEKGYRPDKKFQVYWDQVSKELKVKDVLDVGHAGQGKGKESDRGV